MEGVPAREKRGKEWRNRNLNLVYVCVFMILSSKINHLKAKKM